MTTPTTSKSSMINNNMLGVSVKSTIEKYGFFGMFFWLCFSNDSATVSSFFVLTGVNLAGFKKFVY